VRQSLANSKSRDDPNLSLRVKRYPQASEFKSFRLEKGPSGESTEEVIGRLLLGSHRVAECPDSLDCALKEVSILEEWASSECPYSCWGTRGDYVARF